MQARDAILIFATALAAVSSTTAEEPGSAVDGIWQSVVLTDLSKNSRSATAGENGAIGSWTAYEIHTESWKNHESTWDLQLGIVPPPVVMRAHFGPRNGVPLAGDFDGDGSDELAIYADGQWFVDFNGNERWDGDDLVLRFGRPGDRPVVGEWNGDGKADIGVFSSGGRGIATSPPTARSYLPHVFSTTVRVCNAQLCLGREFAVRERHVAASARIPVVGDWSGCGRTLLGTFEDGRWTLDRDIDGPAIDGDITFEFGRRGDLPIVGDFNRDGRVDFGIWRQGNWYIDLTGDHQFGAGDLHYQLGEVDDLPVVGDWDGDGGDQIGIVRRTDSSSPRRPDSALSSVGRSSILDYTPAITRAAVSQSF